ncbi:MAG: hypothetical protein ACI90V_014302, partial [Bacillariaceae sp.]
SLLHINFQARANDLIDDNGRAITATTDDSRSFRFFLAIT